MNFSSSTSDLFLWVHTRLYWWVKEKSDVNELSVVACQLPAHQHKLILISLSTMKNFLRSRSRHRSNVRIQVSPGRFGEVLTRTPKPDALERAISWSIECQWRRVEKRVRPLQRRNERTKQRLRFVSIVFLYTTMKVAVRRHEWFMVGQKGRLPFLSLSCSLSLSSSSLIRRIDGQIPTRFDYENRSSLEKNQKNKRH